MLSSCLRRLVAGIAGSRLDIRVIVQPLQGSINSVIANCGLKIIKTDHQISGHVRRLLYAIKFNVDRHEITPYWARSW